MGPWRGVCNQDIGSSESRLAGSRLRYLWKEASREAWGEPVCLIMVGTALRIDLAGENRLVQSSSDFYVEFRAPDR